MKIFSTHIILITLALSNLANSAATDIVAVAKKQTEIKFAGSTFVRRSTKIGQIAYSNTYYLPKQNAKNWSHKVNMLVYPKLSDPAQRVAAIAKALDSKKIPYQVFKPTQKNTAAIALTEHLPKVSIYTLFFFHPSRDSKMLIGRQFTFRATIDKKEKFIALTKKQQANWLKSLPAVVFPAFEFPPKQSAPAPPKLAFIKETVDNIQKSGKLVLINANFTRKLGGDKFPPRPFSIRLPRVKNIFITGAPKVAETARITFASDDKKFRESIRFVSLRVATNVPMDARLARAIQLMHAKFIKQLSKAYTNVQIGMQYRTKVGSSDAAVIQAKMKDKKGATYFVKCVAILDEQQAGGLGILMTLAEGSDTPEEVKARLYNGHAQQVLHSLRILDLPKK